MAPTTASKSVTQLGFPSLQKLEAFLSSAAQPVHDGAGSAADTTYRGVHVGVTKSGVKKGKNGLTRLSAADCRPDVIHRFELPS